MLPASTSQRCAPLCYHGTIKNFLFHKKVTSFCFLWVDWAPSNVFSWYIIPTQTTSTLLQVDHQPPPVLHPDSRLPPPHWFAVFGASAGLNLGEASKYLVEVDERIRHLLFGSLDDCLFVVSFSVFHINLGDGPIQQHPHGLPGTSSSRSAPGAMVSYNAFVCILPGGMILGSRFFTLGSGSFWTKPFV